MNDGGDSSTMGTSSSSSSGGQASASSSSSRPVGPAPWPTPPSQGRTFLPQKRPDSIQFGGEPDSKAARSFAGLDICQVADLPRLSKPEFIVAALIPESQEVDSEGSTLTRASLLAAAAVAAHQRGRWPASSNSRRSQQRRVPRSPSGISRTSSRRWTLGPVLVFGAPTQGWLSSRRM